MVGQTWNSYTQEMPSWCAEFLASHCLLPGGSQADISQFGFADAQTITVDAAATNGSAVTISLADKLTSEIPKGQVLDFGGGKTFQLTERANIGATSLVGDLSADLTGNESYDYQGVSGRTAAYSGTLVGRTYAERDAGDGYGPADLANDDEIFILAFANNYMEQDAGITLVRHRHHIYENELPGWAELTTTEQAKVRELYDCLTLPANA